MLKKSLSILFFFGVLTTALSSQHTIGLFQNSPASVNGYTLFTVAQGTYLIDNCGRVVNQWSHEFSPGLASYLTDQGTLLRCSRLGGPFSGGGIGGLITEQTWEGETLWSFDYANEDVHHHHDIEPMPNGNVMIIAWEKHSPEEAMEMGASTDITYSPTQLVEVKPLGLDSGMIVWEWHLWDHLIQDVSPGLPNFGVVAEHPERVNINAYPPTGSFSTGDWIHCNSVAYNETRDELVIGSRDFSEVWVIDHSTTSEEAAGSTGGDKGKGGDLLYRWGNPQAYDRGTIDDQKLFGQHNVLWVPEGNPYEGAFSVFNNGTGFGGPGYSKVSIFQPPLDSNGHYIMPTEGAAGPLAPIWEYQAEDTSSLYSQNQGGAYPMADGHVLINSSTQGDMIEVDVEGNILWRYKMPISNGVPLAQGQQWGPSSGTTFKAIRYLPDFSGFIGKDLTPGEPIEINPIDVGCEIYVGLQEMSGALTGVSVRLQADGQLLVRNNLYSEVMFDVHDLNGRLLTRRQLIAGSQVINLGRHSNSLLVYRAIDMSTGQQLSGRIVQLND